MILQDFERAHDQKVPKWFESPELHIFHLKIPLGYQIFGGNVESTEF